MKVLVAVTYYRPHVSGLTIYVERLAKALVDRLSDTDIAKYMSPIFYDFARLARIGEEVLKRQSAPKTPATPPPEATETVSAKTNGQGRTNLATTRRAYDLDA